MPIRPRWTLPINFRQEDKSILDAAVALADADRIQITSLVRNALADYVKTRLGGEGVAGMKKMDDYFSSTSFGPIPPFKILTPKELKLWNDSDLLAAARQVRSRKQELEGELKRRGFHLFRW